MRRSFATGIPIALSLIFFSVILMTLWWLVVFSRTLNSFLQAEFLLLERQIFLSQTTNPEILPGLLSSGKVIYSVSCELIPCFDSLRQPGEKIQISPQFYNAIVNERNRRMNMIFSETIFLISVLGTAGFYMIYLILREKRLNTEREEFLAMATHELKHPLARISLMLESLKRQTIPENRRNEFIQKGISEIQTVKIQLENILKVQELTIFSRKETSSYSVSGFVLSVADYMKSTREDGNERIVFTSRIPEALDFCTCNRQGLQTILTNLIKNALIYSEDKIEVNLVANKKNAVIEVKDSGIGFTPEEIKKIGMMFFRSSRHQVQNTKGTGLGLFTVMRLVSLLGLKLDIESDGEQKGSTFSLTLR